MTDHSPAAGIGLPELPQIPGWLDLAICIAMALTVGTAWLGVLVLCWAGVS